MELWGDGGEDNWVNWDRGDILLLLGYCGDGAMESTEHASKRISGRCLLAVGAFGFLWAHWR